MNNFFANVGKNLADKIQPVTNKPSSFLDNLPCVKHSFFFSPASPDEIATIIRSLKPKKSNRENDIETKFLKYSNVIISPVMCNIFNSCIEQGKFPDSLTFNKSKRVFMTHETIYLMLAVLLLVEIVVFCIAGSFRGWT